MPNDTHPPQFRVPREDRSLLCIPPLETVPSIVDKNRNRFAASAASLHGRSLIDLRAATRLEALAAARTYTASILETDLPDIHSDSVIATGHQPELFHVGVWAKNFALASAARQCHSVAVNLIIDNDTLNSTTLNIPEGTRVSPHIERIPFDVPRSPRPWEEATIRDKSLFRNFGSHVQNKIQQTWGYNPLVGNAWHAAVRQMQVSNRLCDALAAVRITSERMWGQTNLELPMSRLCETNSFYWFTAHLLSRLPELHAIYNKSVTEYRTLHRLRNRMQPVPDLDRSGEWFEAPFWIWQPEAIQRGRLFARRSGSLCELRDEKEIIAKLPMAEEGPLDSAVELLGQLPARGYRLRTRALTTTLFARVCLADLFVHGIGGAKYDAITDQICAEFFGMSAPEFLTVSATLYLPLGGPFAASEVQLCDLNHKIRDLAYNPDRYVGDLPEARHWILEKSELLKTAHRLRESNHSRGRLTREQHLRLNEIRSMLQTYTGTLRTNYESERQTILSRISANQLIRNREFSFVLFPEGQLRDFLKPLSD